MDKGGEHLYGARDRHPEEMTASTELVAAVGTRHRSIVRLPWTSQAEAQAHDLKMPQETPSSEDRACRRARTRARVAVKQLLFTEKLSFLSFFVAC